MKKLLHAFTLLLLSVLFISSCKTKQKDILPSPEFVSYINAYTGGIISPTSVVRIELVKPQPSVQVNSEVKEQLFSFKPALKGTAFWVNNQCIEFIPDEGELQQGQLYRADFSLGKIQETAPGFQTFSFSFRVEKQSFALELEPCVITQANPGNVSVKGEIRFSNPVTAETVAQMLSSNFPKIEPTIEATPDPKVFTLSYEGIPRKAEEQTFSVEAKGKPAGIEKKLKEEVVIPRTAAFYPVSVQALRQPENGIEVIFSEPLETEQDLRGLIALSHVSSSYVFQSEDNRVRIFFEHRPRESVGVEIYEGIKSATGMSTAGGESYYIAFASLDPQVELPYPGNILPDSKNLILPFKTVNINAVDVRIIQVFESNVLTFMQSNDLSSTRELRRFGRLVKKQTIRLDQETDVQPNTWYDFSIDLSRMIQQQPGAIYHIDFSFLQAYSLYPGANTPAKNQSDSSTDRQGMVTLGGSQLSEKEEAYWNEASPYYYEYDDIDWSEYNWDEADDPAKPSYYMNNRHASCNVISSNLGVIAKGGPQNKFWLSVSDINTVKPVKDAEVTLYNYQLQPVGSGQTDADGFAVIETKGKAFVLMAKYQGQTSYLRVADGEEQSLSRFDVGGEEVQQGLKGYVYGERGVWRPGDTLFLSFVLEDRLQRLPASHPVTFELYNPNGQFYHKETSTSGVNGFYTFKIATKAEDPTGLWSAYVKVGGSSFYKALRIESIKPNRLKINLNIPDNRIDVAQKEVQAKLVVAWLTGATARNLEAKIEMEVSASSSPFKGYERFTFRNPATDFTSDHFEVYDGKLDENGNANVRFKVPRPDYAPGMLRANIVCRVFEPGGDASISSQSVPFSPFDTYVGISLNQKKNSWIETDTDHVFDVVTLNAKGEPKDVGQLEYKIYRLSWSWWWEHSNESFASYVNNRSSTPEESGTISTKNGKGSIKFRINYPSWGRYLIYVKDPNGGHATGDVAYVDWPSWRGRAQASDPSGITMLSFSTDKTTYEVGETVSVMIPSASSGRALVALENGSAVLSRNWIDIASGGNTKYTFKVTEEMAPNFYLHISLLQPHAQTNNDLPIRMYGVIPVLVENKNSHLTPRIEMPDVLRPEQPFTVKVSEQNGKPMTYTLAIVDDGLLDLTNFKTPDPWARFNAREALGIKTWDLYDYIIGAFGEKYGALFSIGGDETLNPSGQKANRFKPVVKFLGPFVLKKGEKGSHNITLPPYVGSVRTMIVAGAPGAYGNAEKTVPVRSPLMLLSTLPRVISVGEEILLPVNIFAMEDGVKDVQIQVEVSDKLQLTGDATQSIHFSKTGDEICRFSLKAGNVTGAAKVKISATGGGHSASESIEIEVRNPNPITVTAQEKLLSAGGEERFDYEIDPASLENQITLEVSRIPSVDLKRRYDWLENYEHCCTEQLISKGFPWLYVDQFREVDEALTKLIKTNVTEAIKQIYSRQLPSGGFVYWPGQADANEWITSFAGNFLLKAKEKGYEVNDGVMKRWKSYQQKTARNWAPQKNANGEPYYYQSDLVQAYRLYTLALAGATETGAMNRLRELTNISPQAKWRLAAAYALDGRQKAANELIFNVKPIVDPYRTNSYTYGSSLRDEAMILETMILLNDMSGAFAQARVISEKLSNASWFDTQSTVFSLIAMGALAEKAGQGDLKFDWTVNGEKQKAVVSAMPVYQTTLPASALKTSGNITIKNQGGGELFVRLIARGRPLIDKHPALSNNLKIDVSYTDLDGRGIDPARLQQGTDFIAVVKVSNTGGIDYTDVALTHIVPAGWEIFNERMLLQEGEANASQAFTYQDIRDDRVFTYFDLPYNRSKTFRLRLQAAYAGKYILPALFCEAMYDTQAQARTTAGRVEVIR